MPDPWFRLLAVPNGIAMIALGYSLWRIAGAEPTQQADVETVAPPMVIPTGTTAAGAA